MDSQTKSYKGYINTILLSSILIFGFGSMSTARAADQNQGNPIVIAHGGHGGHHGGHHGHHGGHHRNWGGWGVYFGPGYYRHGGAYWTGWRTYYRHGHRCARNCLVSRYSGSIIRCQKRCYY